MSTPESPAASAPRRRLVFLLPLAAFVALAAVFLIRLESGGDPEAIPSALIGKPVRFRFHLTNGSLYAFRGEPRRARHQRRIRRRRRAGLHGSARRIAPG